MAGSDFQPGHFIDDNDSSSADENGSAGFLQSGIVYFGLTVIVAFVLSFILFFVYQTYEHQIIDIFHKMWIYVLILTPVFLLLGLYLLMEDLGSIISLLSFACMLTIVFCGYLYLMIGFSPEAFEVHGEDANPAVHLYCIVTADVVIVLLMIASVIQHCLKNRREETEIDFLPSSDCDVDDEF